MNEKILILKYNTIALSTISCILTLIGLFTPFYSIDSTKTEYGVIFNFYCLQEFIPSCPMVIEPDIFDIIRLQSWVLLILMAVLIPIFGSRLFIVDKSERDIIIPIESANPDENESNKKKRKFDFSLKKLFDASENKKTFPSLIKLHAILLLIIFFEFMFGLYENNLKMVYFSLQYIDYGDFILENHNFYYFNIGIVAYIFATLIELFNSYMVMKPKVITPPENKNKHKTTKEVNIQQKYQESEAKFLESRIIPKIKEVKIP